MTQWYASADGSSTYYSVDGTPIQGTDVVIPARPDSTYIYSNGSWVHSPAIIAAQGLQLISTSSPSLNGVYPIDAMTQQNVGNTQIYIVVKGTFPTGRSTLNFPDVNGALHAFTIPQFVAFAEALAAYIADLDQNIIPSNPVTIA